jgi:hypothetical protein
MELPEDEMQRDHSELQRRDEDVGGPGEKPEQPGGSKEPAVEPGEPQRASARLAGGFSVQLERLKRELDIAIVVANHVNLDEKDCTIASERLIAACIDLEALLKGNAAAEGLSDVVWQQEYAAFTVDARAAKERVAANLKALRDKQRKKQYEVAKRAVDRTVATIQQVMQDDDLEEINELYQQLSAEVREMEAAAVQIEDDQFRPDEASLTEAGKSLRKLAKKKREIWHKWCAIGFQNSQERGRVLLRDGAAASSTYKLARVVRGLSDEKSGRIQRVPVANKSFTEEVFRTPTKPICKIVLVVPAEDAKLPTLPADAGPPVDLPALPAPTGPDVGLSATADTPGDLVTPGTKMPEPTGSVEDVLDLVTPNVDEPVEPASGGQDVASPASAGSDESISASGDPEMVMPEPVVDVPAPAGPPVDQAAPDELPVKQPAPKGLPEDPGEQVEEEAAPGDRTHGGRLRPRKNFYSWDFPDRMKKM